VFAVDEHHRLPHVPPAAPGTITAHVMERVIGRSMSNHDTDRPTTRPLSR
jgi:hypothetical protein